jgi:uncharacterized protein
VLGQFEALHTVARARSPQHLAELMRQAVPVIHQPPLERDDLVARPDFLVRQASGDYQPADAKLKRDIDAEDAADKAVLIQVGVYRRLMGNGLPVRLVLGTGDQVEIGPDAKADKLAEEFIASMRDLLGSSSPPPARHGATKCGKCPYHDVCMPEFIARGDLTLLADVQRPAAESLEQHGIRTITQLAATKPADIPPIPYFKHQASRTRAVLQARAYVEKRYFVLEPPRLPAGTWVHFDIETNPLSPSGSEHIYLWGLLLPPYQTNDAFRAIWTDSEADDREGWKAFLGAIAKLRRDYPDLVLAHYSPFERQKIALYARRYPEPENPEVAWLLGDASPLFDLCKVLKKSLVLPTKDYSLKTVCKHPDLVDFQWQDAGSGSQWSVVQYVRFLRSAVPDERQKLKDGILQYNLDDVKATRALETWLRAISEFGPEADAASAAATVAEESSVSAPSRRRRRSAR